jgi:K+/H+ antiporter YhaU regulatory subunit KhtT
MADIVKKIDAYTVEIAPAAIVPAPVRFRLYRLKRELNEAKAELQLLKDRQAEARAPIIEKIALLQARFDAAAALIVEDPADATAPVVP